MSVDIDLTDVEHELFREECERLAREYLEAQEAAA